MPPIRVLTYQESEGDVPLHTWLREVGTGNRDAAARCRDLIQRLADHGHALRRPSSAPLRDEIHELRARVGRVNYRVLYFFNGRGVAVLTSGCTKASEVDDADIDRAVRYRDEFRADSDRHAYRPPRPKLTTPPRKGQTR
ncbi:MAG: type II toxin-antitoxin system RelE/ParE family toxin [Gemmatimonadaceae bacterium]